MTAWHDGARNLEMLVQHLGSFAAKIREGREISPSERKAVAFIAQSVECSLDPTEELLRDIGLRPMQVACDQMDAFRERLLGRHDPARAYVTRSLTRAASPAQITQIRRKAVEGTTVQVLECMNQRMTVNRNRVAELLAATSTFISPLIDGEKRRVFVAMVGASVVNNFDGLLVELSPTDHVIFVRDCEAEKVLDVVQHECGHLVDRYRSRAGENPQQTSASPPTPVYAEDQRDVDERQKELITLWVSHEMPLTQSSGALIDAGSTCLEMWKRVIEQLKKGDLRYLTVLTNNFLVLDEYQKNLDSVARYANVLTYGSTFDAEHLALFPVDEEEILRQMMREDFFPSHIFIGTNGVQFYPDGRISFGYHGDQPELLVKRLLFHKPTDQRIMLAAPSKIGDAGAMRFDILSLSNLDTSTPLYLVTAEPSEKERERFISQFKTYTSETVQERLRKIGLRFNWITVGKNKGQGLVKIEKLSHDIGVSLNGNE